eukprot:PITA_15088
MAQPDQYETEMIISDEDSDPEYDIVMAASDDDGEDHTSAAEVRRGEDIQGLQWQRTYRTRQKYREYRMIAYESPMDVPQSQLRMDQLREICPNIQKGENFYEFQRNTKSVKPTSGHFQLRELVWATSNHDVYLSSANSIVDWSALSHKLVNVIGPVIASGIHLGAPLADFREDPITCMAVKDNLLVLGGIGGEFICKYLDIKDVNYCSKITEIENGEISITNSIEIYQSPGGATRVMTAIGDNVDGFLSDWQTGKVVATLQGHLDYSCSSAWHPDGTVFATGNQDTTCRLWDVRNTSTSLEVLKGNMAAIRSIRFSSDGQFMAMAEQADFVHIFHTKHLYNKSQEIDFFGEITGISFSPDTESLFIGIELSSLLEYKRRNQSFYLDFQI